MVGRSYLRERSFACSEGKQISHSDLYLLVNRTVQLTHLLYQEWRRGEIKWVSDDQHIQYSNLRIVRAIESKELRMKTHSDSVSGLRTAAMILCVSFCSTSWR